MRMYSESLKHEKISTIKGIFLVVGIVLVIMLVAIGARSIALFLKIPGVDYLLYILLIILATVIIKTRIQDYIYTLEGMKLVFERELGTRVKLLATIELRTIVWSGFFTELPKEYAEIGYSKISFKPKRETYCIVYLQKDKMAVIGFSPTPVMIDKIQAKLAVYKKKEK